VDLLQVWKDGSIMKTVTVEDNSGDQRFCTFYVDKSTITT